MLQLENVKVVKEERTILSIPSFHIRKGEVLGIMGPNGAGKSTLLKVASLLEAPSEGRVLLSGKERSAGTLSLEERRRLAVVLQQPLLFHGTVWDNIAVGLKLRKCTTFEVKSRVSGWLERFHLKHLAREQARHLSGGEAARVCLARALVLEPDLLFLDEPFSALDYPAKVALLKDLKNILNETNTTTFFISHDISEIKYAADRLAIVMDGECKQIGRTGDVLASPNSDTEAFLRQWELG